MKIREVNDNKKQFISLLLLADEQENMVECYLEKGAMYVLEDNEVKAMHVGGISVIHNAIQICLQVKCIVEKCMNMWYNILYQNCTKGLF